jgi:hypothetical protein
VTRYRATLDRAGWALALGAACTGSGAALLGWASETGDPVRLAGLWAVGAVVGVVAIAGLGGPIWWLTQRRGRRGPVAAGLTGALVAGGVTLGVLTQGLGAGLPVADAATLTATWTSAAATALVAAFLGALVALAMWLVSYRAV